MFGIGLPEFILIMALALIVVGPDKLPDLARSVAKGILELKKTANTLKESLTEEGNPLSEIKPELEEVAQSMKEQILKDVNNDADDWQSISSQKKAAASESSDTEETTIIDVEAVPAPQETAPEENTGSTEPQLSAEDRHLDQIRKTGQNMEQ